MSSGRVLHVAVQEHNTVAQCVLHPAGIGALRAEVARERDHRDVPIAGGERLEDAG